MGGAVGIPTITSTYRIPTDIVSHLTPRMKVVSEQKCLQLLRDIRWLIIQHMDSETTIINVLHPSRFRKYFEWKLFKKAEDEAAKELYGRRKFIDEKTINDCFESYRRLYTEIKISIISSKLRLEPNETSFFSNISVIRGTFRDRVSFKDIMAGMEDIFQKFERDTCKEGNERNLEVMVRPLTEDILIAIGKSIQEKPNCQSCIFKEELERYEKEMKSICRVTMKMGNIRSILTQYRKQLQICIFYAVKDELDTMTMKVKMSSNINNIPLSTDDETPGIDMKDTIDIQRKEAADELKKQLNDLLHRRVDDTDTETKEKEIAILLHVYKDEMKHVYSTTEGKDLQNLQENFLREKFETQLETEIRQKPRDVPSYTKTLKNALDTALTSDEDLPYKREENIILDMEQKRWNELEKFNETSIVDDQKEFGSDFDDTFQEESKIIQKITQAQVAIVDRSNVSRNAMENNETMTTAQAIKAQVEECKKEEAKFREMVRSQIQSANEQLQHYREKYNSTVNQEDSDDDDDSLGQIRRIEEELDQKYNEIERIGEEFDESEDDSDSVENEERKQERIKRIEEKVKQIQKLVDDMRNQKYDVLHMIHKDISELKAAVNGLTREFIVMAEGLKKIQSDLKKTNKNHGKQLSEKLVALVETFDKERFKKLASKLTIEDEEMIRNLLSHNRNEMFAFLQAYLKPFEEMMQQQTPRRPGFGTVQLKNADDIQKFFTGILKKN